MHQLLPRGFFFFFLNEYFVCVLDRVRLVIVGVVGAFTCLSFFYFYGGGVSFTVIILLIVLFRREVYILQFAFLSSSVKPHDVERFKLLVRCAPVLSAPLFQCLTLLLPPQHPKKNTVETPLRCTLSAV